MIFDFWREDLRFAWLIFRILWMVTTTVLILTGLAILAANAASLPDVSTRVGRAQSFTYDWTADQYQHKLGTRDVIWNNQPSQAQGALNLPAGTLSSAYITVARVPPYAEAYGSATVTGWNIGWFQENRPQWILLGGDHKTPAYEYGDIWVPLDYSNPEVQSFRAAYEVAPILSAGYQSISVDNVSPQNDFDRQGVCSVSTANAPCEAAGGVWTQKWSGQLLGDSKFVSDQVVWLQFLAQFVHARNAALMANITYNPIDLAGTGALIHAADIWYDEAGFSGDSLPSACDPAGGYGVVDQAWVDKINFVYAANVPYVSENSICALTTPAARSQKVLDYALASYLLVKRANTYFLWYFDDTSAYQDETPGGIWPETSWVHGPALGPTSSSIGGVYKRAFANGIALVNPSSTASLSFNLGSATYHDLLGKAYAGTILLPPVTGLVLAVDAAPPPPPPPPPPTGCHPVVSGQSATFPPGCTVTIQWH